MSRDDLAIFSLEGILAILADLELMEYKNFSTSVIIVYTKFAYSCPRKLVEDTNVGL